jgi:hypothetical protein
MCRSFQRFRYRLLCMVDAIQFNGYGADNLVGITYQVRTSIGILYDWRLSLDKREQRDVLKINHDSVEECNESSMRSVPLD